MSKLALVSIVAIAVAGCRPPAAIEGTRVGDCTNGTDDDADGTIDCGDSGCASNAACLPDGGPIDGGSDSGVDAPPGDDAGADDAGEPIDAGETPDGEVPDATMDDAGPIGACVAFAPALEAGLGTHLGNAIAYCTRQRCLACAIAGGTGPDCTGGTLSSCILACVRDGDAGPCGTDGSCDTGATCEPSTNRCSLDAAAEVRAAIARGELDDACTGCYAGISECVATESCTLSCLSPGCTCDVCQCDNGCPAAFAACSGLAPYLDCAAVASSCP